MDKKVIWLIFAVMVICSAATLYMGTFHRFTYAAEDDIFSEENVPEKGQFVPILCKGDGYR
ncbi:MAG: hypothetical protein PUB52_06465 [Lachnospiraceae bacterium]|nr:hypothetical protein [Lachnospiraceae bacterium]